LGSAFVGKPASNSDPPTLAYYGQTLTGQQASSISRIRLPRALHASRIGRQAGFNVNNPGEVLRIRFRFVLKLTTMTAISCGQRAAFVVDGLFVRLRGFRKSHQLIPASPKICGVAAGNHAPTERAPVRLRRALTCVRINKVQR
jgi:hypothetical protein